MKTMIQGRSAPWIGAAGALAFALALPPGSAWAQDKVYEMKISTPTIHDVPDTMGANFLAAVEKDSGGRIKGQVYPASQLGSIPRQIEGTQFGSIQCAIIPPEFFVGIDDRYEVLAAPGLVGSLAQGQKVAANPAVLKLMLSLGTAKGLHGVGLFMAEPSAVISKTPIRHLADFKGKKLRTFASKFQTEAWSRLGATPVAMSLGDVLPALQQGTIDGAVAGMGPFTHMHFSDAAKYVTMTNQPAIFLIVVVNKKWYESLPADLQKIIDKDGAEQSIAIDGFAVEQRKKADAVWTASGGEEISLPPDEQAQMMKTLSTVGSDVSKSDPQLAAAYKVVSDAAARAAQTPSQ
ncbi:MAG TPA: TRAP transporter substrate-binding protein [Xanthobacteraceae bacterium]|nr:TRAP transporter substrate-binding protein [Xanthobacteraceae bacterium]